MLSPLALLLALIGLTAVAAALSEMSRRRRSSAVAAVAAEWHMRYLVEDRFNLAARVAAALPIPGAADVVVRDLIYGEDRPTSDELSSLGHSAPSLRYFFTVEYTVGVVRGKRRQVAVGTLTESRTGTVGEGYSKVTLAPAGLGVIDQYQHLKNSLGPVLTPPA
jgi:hypothetical protein